MVNCMLTSVNKFLTALFMISWIWIGNYIFLNLFVSILLDGFGEDIPEEEDDDEETKDVYEEDNDDILLVS